MINFLNNLVIGSWVEIKNKREEQFQRGKLKWKAQDNSLFIFIDRRGHKISECSLEQLKAYYTEDFVRLLSTPGSGSAKKPTLGHGYRVFQ